MNVKFTSLAKSLLKFMISFLLTIALVAILMKNVQLLISETDSLSQHYFLLYRHITPKLNNYSTVWSDWYGKRVIKKIVGVSGDRIWYDHHGQLLVNKQLIGIPCPIATDGSKLNPIKAQIIADGLVFLAGSHPRSFDSRYAEFGLVAVNKLEGLVVAIL